MECIYSRLLDSLTPERTGGHGRDIKRCQTARLWAIDKAHLLILADAYKEQIYTRLHELVPGRMARLDRSAFEGKTTEEVLTLVYMQGVTESLDAFDVAELLNADQPPTRLDA